MPACSQAWITVIAPGTSITRPSMLMGLRSDMDGTPGGRCQEAI